MNRTQFVIATAIILFLAFVIGWMAHLVFHRLGRKGAADLSEVDRLAERLHEAEELRDEAVLFLEEREAELINRCQQSEAELHAAMDGLRAARREIEEQQKTIAALERSNA